MAGNDFLLHNKLTIETRPDRLRSFFSLRALAVVGSEPEQSSSALDSGGPQGIGGLLGMATLDPAIAG